MNLDPAWRAGHVLTVILGAPALHEAETNGAHLGELVDRLVTVRHRVAEQLRELDVVEDLEAAAGRNLTDGCGVEVVVVVALATLHEDAAVTETLGEHLAAHIVQMHTCKHTQPTIQLLLQDDSKKVMAHKITGQL